MKTVKPVGEKGGVPVRVKDMEADIRAKSGKWVLCSKSEWKDQVRDAAKKEAEVKAQEKRDAEIKAKQEELKAKQARKKEIEKKVVGKK